MVSDEQLAIENERREVTALLVQQALTRFKFGLQPVIDDIIDALSKEPVYLDIALERARSLKLLTKTS